jgi:hypothetical protein
VRFMERKGTAFELPERLREVGRLDEGGETGEG